ncbi:MAG: hemerythrin domain-containing protein [Hyphomicrobiales bacterium]|nr:hemerythrin domain-containing protein [Hyphomicrobiales bacterium]
MAETVDEIVYNRTNNKMIDEDHAHFAELLMRCRTAADAELLALFDEMVGHFEAHFAREEALMQETGFPPMPIHTREHKRVLAWAANISDAAKDGDIERLRAFLTVDVPRWFADHAASMDTATANWAAQRK